MRKVAAVAAVMTISLGALTACSGNSAYCKELKDNSDATSVADGDMSSTIAKMKKVMDKAPSDVKDDWETLINYLEKSEQAKNAADKTKAAADLAAEASKVSAAVDAISKNAKDKCNIEMKK